MSAVCYHFLIYILSHSFSFLSVRECELDCYCCCCRWCCCCPIHRCVFEIQSSIYHIWRIYAVLNCFHVISDKLIFLHFSPPSRDDNKTAKVYINYVCMWYKWPIKTSYCCNKMINFFKTSTKHERPTYHQ